MNIDMQSPEIQKLRKEDYKAYRRLYNHHIAYSIHGIVMSVIMVKIIDYEIMVYAFKDKET